MGLFRAASLQTQHARFPGTELSSDLCRVRDGVRVDPVMARGADDECLAPHFRHEGRPRGPIRSFLAEVGEFGDLVDVYCRPELAQLALPHPEPNDQLFPRGPDRDRRACYRTKLRQAIASPCCIARCAACVWPSASASCIANAAAITCRAQITTDNYE